MTKRKKKNSTRTKALEVDIELVVRGHVGSLAVSIPSTVIRRHAVRLESACAMRTLEAAQILGFQMLVENRLDEFGQVVLDVSMYADEVSVDEDEIDELWPRPHRWSSVQRDITEDQSDLFEDPRWGQQAARGLWVWLRTGACYRGDAADDEDRDLMWVADFSDISLGAV